MRTWIAMLSAALAVLALGYSVLQGVWINNLQKEIIELNEARLKQAVLINQVITLNGQQTANGYALLDLINQHTKILENHQSIIATQTNIIRILVDYQKDPLGTGHLTIKTLPKTLEASK